MLKKTNLLGLAIICTLIFMQSAFSEKTVVKPVGKPFSTYPAVWLLPAVSHEPSLKPALEATLRSITAETEKIMDRKDLHGFGKYSVFFVEAYEKTGDARWLNIAEQRAALLIKTATEENGGYCWPDNLTHPIRKDQFGTDLNHHNTGMALFFARLYEATGKPVYRDYALGTANWLRSVAVEHPGGALAWFWHKDRGPFRTGECNGAAGIATVFYRMYMILGEPHLKNTGDGALDWLISVAVEREKGVSWPLEIVPEQSDPEYNWARKGKDMFHLRSSGKGAAGIARAFLLGSVVNGGVLAPESRSPRTTAIMTHRGSRGADEKRAAQYIEYSRRAAEWVMSQAIWDSKTTCHWKEDDEYYAGISNPIYSARSSGAPCSGGGGIGAALANMWQVTGNEEYKRYAIANGEWRKATSTQSGKYVWWNPTGLDPLPTKNIVLIPLLTIGDIFDRNDFIEMAVGSARTMAAAGVQTDSGMLWTKNFTVSRED